MEQEKQLVNQAKSGNLQAFQQLVGIYSRKLYAAAYRVLGDQGHAEDCVQEVFVKVYRKLDSFDERSKFSTWLYSVTMNTAIDLQRKLARHQNESDEDISEMEHIEGSAADTPESSHWQSSLSKITQHAVMQLNEELRVAFTLRHFDGRSIEEISEILEINPNTVKNRIFRAVGRLKVLLAPKLAHAEVGNYE